MVNKVTRILELVREAEKLRRRQDAMVAELVKLHEIRDGTYDHNDIADVVYFGRSYNEAIAAIMERKKLANRTQ